MVYVQRRNGVVVGVFTKRQPQEDGSDLTDPTPLADDDPAVTNFYAQTEQGPELSGKGVASTLISVLFHYENRLRALEGKSAVTRVQYVTAIKALLG